MFDVNNPKNQISEECNCKSNSCICDSNKEVIIDFLYLDLTVCDRCQGTEDNLEDATKVVTPVLEAMGYKIVLNKINITTRELAYKYEFLSSPTIRVNKKDIALEVKENACGCCSSLSGHDVDCRTFVYNNNDYNEPPKAMLIDAILRTIYSETTKDTECLPYSLPENLEKYFDGIEKKNTN